MPPKTRVGRDMIVKAAFNLVRREGVGNLNARSLSKELGSSTQPILYHFSSMEEVKGKAYEMADEYHNSYLMHDLEKEENPLLSLGLRYIRFSIEEKNLFLFLFQSGHFGGSVSNLFDNEGMEPIFQAFRGGREISEEEIKRVFFPLFSAIHGNASLLANNALIFNEEETKDMLILLYECLLEKTMEGRNEE